MTSKSDPSLNPDAEIARLYRSDWGRLLSLLVARTRRLDLAEDALSESFARASQRWRRDGVPSTPKGWLYRTAHRLILDRLRSEAMAARKAPLLTVHPSWIPPEESTDDLPDERLQLILLCCHPALSPTSRAALALRLILGVSTDEIAHLFLVAPSAMAARITRAKKKIVRAGIPLALPAGRELASRLEGVCQAIYLAFTAGYAPSSGGELLRVELAGEAVRLASILHELTPEAPQAKALLALLLLQHSRRDARVLDGRLVTLAEQNRDTWHWGEIHVGLTIVHRLSPLEGYAEELRLQALIAGEHARVRDADATNWEAIVRLYESLEQKTGSPIVRLNHAVALAELRGPDAGLELLIGLDERLPRQHRLASVHGELARRAGHLERAHEWFGRALDLCDNEVEHRFIREQMCRLERFTEKPNNSSPAQQATCEAEPKV